MGKSIDLVITDLVMPGMGGRELLRRLREINPAVKAIALTGHVLSEELEALRAEDFVHVVHKPIDINTFGLDRESDVAFKAFAKWDTLMISRKAAGRQEHKNNHQRWAFTNPEHMSARVSWRENHRCCSGVNV